MFDKLQTSIKQAIRPALRQAAREHHDEYDMGEFGRTFYFLTGAAVVALSIIFGMAVVAAITFSPDGWPGIIGQWFASVCLGTDSCDFSTLQSAFAVSVIIITGLIVLIGITFERAWLMNDHPMDELYAGINRLADDTIRLREQNQTVMAMLFMVAPASERERLAELFADTLDDEESEQLRKLIEEAASHSDTTEVESEETDDVDVDQSRAGSY